MPVKKVAKVFHSFEEAEQADREFYALLTPEERLRILYELIRRGSGDPPPRFERVCRITKLK